VGCAFIFLEASLETIPQEIASHRTIKADARRRGKRPDQILLDDSKHHEAMRRLKFREKRGRPDIIHQCLLLLLDSGLKDFEVYVHTIWGKIFRVNPETRLPRNYNRFVGLIEKLFEEKRIVSGEKVLLEFLDTSLGEVVKGRKVLLFKETGRRIDFSEILRGDVAICIGAFPHGDFFEKTVEELGSHLEVSIGSESYTSLYVTCKVLNEYERVRAAENR